MFNPHAMHPDKYQTLAMVTEFTPDFVRLGKGSEHDRMVAQLIHATLGLVSEAGEIADALKKHIIYNRELDTINVMEEIGDLAWYQALALTAIKTTMNEALEKNIAKLQARYGDKFTAARALDRNLDAERAALEAK